MTNLETLLQNLETARKNATQGEVEQCQHFIRAVHIKGLCQGDNPIITQTKEDASLFVACANHIMHFIEIIRKQKEALECADRVIKCSYMDPCLSDELADKREGDLMKFLEIGAKVEEIAKGADK